MNHRGGLRITERIAVAESRAGGEAASGWGRRRHHAALP